MQIFNSLADLAGIVPPPPLAPEAETPAPQPRTYDCTGCRFVDSNGLWLLPAEDPRQPGRAKAKQSIPDGSLLRWKRYKRAKRARVNECERQFTQQFTAAVRQPRRRFRVVLPESRPIPPRGSLDFPA